jgi:hypothetical protein
MDIELFFTLCAGGKKKRNVSGNHMLHCWKQDLAKNDQPTPPYAMFEIGRLSSIDAPYRIPRWRKCQSLVETYVNELFSTKHRLNENERKDTLHRMFEYDLVQ